MVKILSLSALFFVILALLTRSYYDVAELQSSCEVKVLTSNSFYSGIGDILKLKYKEKNNCELRFSVVNGANLISNLFRKQPAQYDMLVGLDFFQISKIDEHQVGLPALGNEFITFEYANKFLAYDEAPLTFFLRDSGQIYFKDLNEFINYLEQKGLNVAVPLKTTSVLGALFEQWMQSSDVDQSLKRNSKQIKFVKSWSEAFGLFERKIVSGFLSFETSEIYFLNANNIKKISLSEGHPNLREYLTFSSSGKISTEQKLKLIDFMFSEEIQNLLLEKNYMWPIALKKHKYSELKTLKLKKTL